KMTDKVQANTTSANVGLIIGASSKSIQEQSLCNFIPTISAGWMSALGHSLVSTDARTCPLLPQ
ncbi:MAG TPA: hypothetical protein VI358_20290, partial [Pseudolabrys sp.]